MIKLILAIVLGLAAWAYGEDWFVKSSGNDANDGSTWALADATLAAAVANASLADGDTIEVDDGTTASPATYDVGAYLSLGAALNGKSITIRKHDHDGDGGSVTITCNATTGNYATLLNATTNAYASGKTITFENVTITSPKAAIGLIRYEGGASGGANLAFSGCTLTCGASDQWVLRTITDSADSSITFTNCTIDTSAVTATPSPVGALFYLLKNLKALHFIGGSWTCAHAGGSNYILVVDPSTIGSILIDDVDMTLVRTSPYYFGTCGASSYINSLVVRNCTISSDRQGIVFWRGIKRSVIVGNTVTITTPSGTSSVGIGIGTDGTAAAANTGPTIIRGNSVTFAGAVASHGAMIGRGADNSEMSYNVVKNADHAFVIKGDYPVVHHNYGMASGRGLYVRMSSYGKAFNNTLISSGAASSTGDVGGAFFDDQGTATFPANWLVQDNILHVTTSSGNGCVYGEANASDAGNVFNRNLVFASGAGTTLYYGYDSFGTTFASRALAVTAMTTRGAYSISGINECVNFGMDTVTTTNPLLSTTTSSAAFARIGSASAAKPTAARLWNPIGAWGLKATGSNVIDYRGP